MTQAACAEKAAAGHADLCHVSTQHARGGELLSLRRRHPCLRGFNTKGQPWRTSGRCVTS